MRTMETFNEDLAKLLKAQPGLSKARIAAALNMEPGDAFRELLDQACEKDVAHKMMDKYYPGSRRAY